MLWLQQLWKVQTKNNLPFNLQNDLSENSFVFSFHNNECIETNLLKLVKEINVPNYAYKKIINWARDAYNTGYKFCPKTTSYKN